VREHVSGRRGACWANAVRLSAATRSMPRALSIAGDSERPTQGTFEPSERYESMAMLLLAIIAILIVSPLLPGPQSPPESAPQPLPDDSAFRDRLGRIGGHRTTAAEEKQRCDTRPS
jgi:hypothetical protein